jgi:hypothetical protein
MISTTRSRTLNELRYDVRRYAETSSIHNQQTKASADQLRLLSRRIRTAIPYDDGFIEWLFPNSEFLSLAEYYAVDAMLRGGGDRAGGGATKASTHDSNDESSANSASHTLNVSEKAHKELKKWYSEHQKEVGQYDIMESS